ncbi:A-kinase anchor protein inhibitor 1 isoform X1 [Meleagris gallopavo]|uniref:A-kinase anchor protein inhibitor 1 isoform X1 n=1 Tax=Meleagris gallopavo TaxID=9103 RepID=UPI0012ABADB8|nr:A-kinase anchor protein inhibitor 1 isoform X1 [Meleagris gallopavo]
MFTFLGIFHSLETSEYKISYTRVRQNWIQYPRSGLTSAEEKGRISYFHVLETRRQPNPHLSGEKPGPEQDEVKLQNASKQIVQTAILQAVQQVSRENQQKEKRTNSSMSFQLERGKLTKKHEKSKGAARLY